jgi:hypothetical protein
VQPPDLSALRRRLDKSFHAAVDKFRAFDSQRQLA